MPPDADVDLGPLAAIALELRDGSIGLDAAKEAAREHGEREVSAQQLVGIASASLDAAGRGQWRLALPVVEVAYEAARAGHTVRGGDAALAEAWVSVGADLIEIAHAALFEQGDIRIFRRADEVASEAEAAADQLGFPRLQGLIDLRFGALVLDAYTAGRSPTNYEGQFGAWVARALQSNDPELKWMASRAVDEGGTADAGSPPASWPAPLEALDIAERWLRRALPLVIPERRGRVFKALTQALEWRGLLGGPVDRDALRSLALQALQELDDDDAQGRLAVMGTLQRLGETAGGADLVSKIEDDWEGFAAAHDPHAAWDAVGQAATLVRDEPRRAVALLRHRRELSTLWADETLRAQHFEAELALFGMAFRPSGFTPEGDLEAAAEAAVALAARATSPAEAQQAAAALVSVMMASTAADREGFALGLVDTLDALDRTLWAEETDALQYLIANLLLGEGVNCVRAGDFDLAASCYRQAVDAFRAIGSYVPMIQCVDNLGDVVSRGASELDEITAWLAAGSLELELAAPASAPAILSLAGHVLAAQAAVGTSPEVIQLLFQVINGRRFAAMLALGTEAFRVNDDTAHLLGREADAEAAVTPDSDLLRPAPYDAGLGDDDLVTAWVDQYETGPSETAEDRVANVQRAIERSLDSALLPADAPPIISIEEIRGCLDERTALVQLLETPWRDGSLATWQLLLTRDFENVAVGKEELPDGQVQASWRGRAVTMPMSGFYVGSIRRAVQERWPPLDVSPEAQDLLASADGRYLRVVEDNRERLEAAGIERLVIIPHSASAFAPLHLAGAPDQPLADSWMVSYLLNVRQLTAGRAALDRRNGVGVFGLSYADQPRLPRLDDSADEARAIATACQTEPVLEAAATESAFRDALTSCRYVHLRAHGRLYVDAPSLHTVFLHPAGGDDGRLRAYEVLPLDLRGLELVTLGACETALGRLDRSGNPRGLPAALLLAGAGAVIGTLWQVLAAASTCFFTELYRTLMEGEGDVTDAFAGAQRATRHEFPEYRHWGAFYLIGGLGGEPA